MIEPTKAQDVESPTLTAVHDGAGAVEGDVFVAPTGYELKAPIGRGGMGVVYRARELAFDRDVAMKFLSQRFSLDSAVGRRFIEEARITGQLQHPGIPPVHQVGTLPDGRPFLVMKLIKGETLDDLLKNRRDPMEDRGRYLAVFEQVAQAVGYAHAHSVIHRDLKPANVMVGSFGEVQVMDWGLAKVLGRASETTVEDVALRTEIRSLRDTGEATQAGSLMGTPAFMPPEQAIGAMEQVTERADVFGLGAILCVILTGEPPYVSETAESTRLLAVRGKLDAAYARLDACRAEPELIALTKRCLAAEPGERPGNAGEVAEAVTVLRADAERRARNAEMERARAEVKAAEERKRRRVKAALVLTFLTLVAVGGFAAWGFDRVRAERRAEQLAREAELKSREAKLLNRQLVTERDVVAALNEAQVLREEGWKQADDTPRWGLTLTAARSSLRRAEALLNTGDATDDLRGRVAAVAAALVQDDRDRALIAELDRIEEENDIRYLMPVTISNRTANRYADAFRTYGVNVGSMPTAEAVAWLKGHRPDFRERLVGAIRNWERARPLAEMPGFGIDVSLVQPAQASAAVAGQPAVQALLNRKNLRDRLKAIAQAVTDDPFGREWLEAVAKSDAAAIRKLFTRPEFARLTSRELSSMVEELSPVFFLNREVLSELLAIAYDRFPGEYWVNFRLAMLSHGRPTKVTGSSPKETKEEAPIDSIRHLYAAVAARPRSAMARVALAMTLLEIRKDDPKGIQMLRGAMALDPASPWPHLFLGFAAMETGNWAELFESFRAAVRVDPDVSFFMIYSLGMVAALSNKKHPSPGELARLYDELIAIQPDHAGGYLVRAAYRYQNHDYRMALADYRKARRLVSADDPLRTLAQFQQNALEETARWEEKLPAVIRGELKPAPGDLFGLAQYCAEFDKKYVLAVRFATDAIAANANMFTQWANLSQCAAWAVQAAAGKGVDAEGLTAEERTGLRRKALAWLREGQSRSNNDFFKYLANQTWKDPLFAPVRDPQALDKLPPEERAEWTRFWDHLPKIEPRELAPPPRAAK